MQKPLTHLTHILINRYFTTTKATFFLKMHKYYLFIYIYNQLPQVDDPSVAVLGF